MIAKSEPIIVEGSGTTAVVTLSPGATVNARVGGNFICLTSSEDRYSGIGKILRFTVIVPADSSGEIVNVLPGT